MCCWPFSKGSQKYVTVPHPTNLQNVNMQQGDQEKDRQFYLGTSCIQQGENRKKNIQTKEKQ